MIKALQNIMKQDKEKFKVPKGVQDAIPVRTIWKKGIFLVGNNKYSKTFQFTDINYGTASDEDKKTMFLAYSELLNSFDSNATTKITIVTRKLNRRDFERNILIPEKKDGLDRLRREFKVEAKVGAPQVAYRETIRQAAECEGKYIRQSGGRGQYGHVWIRFEPNEEGKGFEFVDATVGGSVPREYIKPTEEGLVDAMEKGMIAGYPVIDVKATLFDGSYHDVDSSEMAYKIAASMALKEAGKKCKPVILEPIMNVEVTAPNEYLGSVMGDVSSRRGQITDQEERGNAIIVRAMIPLSEMFGYVTDLRSFTQGRGNYSMKFDHYSEVPKSIAEKIIKNNNSEA